MKTLATVFALPMCLGLALAQDQTTTPPAVSSPENTPSNGQTFYGILVDSKCSSSGMNGGSAGNMPRSSATSRSNSGGNDSLMNRTTPAQSGRDVNTTDRNTSGIADRVGATSGNTAGARDISSADRRSTGEIGRGTPTESSRAINSPATGKATDTRNGNNENPHAVSDAAANNGNWDRSCFISPNSSSFVLQLQDGRTLKVDASGNSRISSQLQSTGRVSSKNKVFRVKVTGSAEGDTLHITDIQI